jgi:hypothetical protein
VTIPSISLSLNFDAPPVNLKVAMARPKLIGLARREAGTLDGDTHGLFLKK